MHISFRQADGLWQNRDFLRLWSGRAISELGSQVSGQAIPLTAVLVLGAGPVELGALSACSGAAALLVGLLAGVWVDRVRRRPLLIVVDLARAAVLATVPLAAILGVLHVAQLYVVIALTGALGVVFDIADRSYLPSLVAREHLVEGNSKLATTGALAEVGGPALGGGLVQLLTAPLAVAFDALSFVVSAVSLLAIRRPEPDPQQRDVSASGAAAAQGLRHEIGEGLRLVYRDPLLRGLTAATATRGFFGNFIGALYALYVIRDLGGSPLLLGILIGLGGLSALPGALLAGRAARRFGPGNTLLGSLFIWSLLALLIPLAPGAGPSGVIPLAVLLLAAAQLFGDWATAIYLVTEVSVRQAVTPDHLLGRMNASVGTVVGGIGLVGALAGGLLGSRLGVRQTLWIAAAGGLLSVIWLVPAGVRQAAARSPSGGADPPN